MRRAIARKIIVVTGLFVHQNETNKQTFTSIRWLNHLGVRTSHSIKKTTKINFQTPCCNTISSNFWDLTKYSEFAHRLRQRKMQAKKFWDKWDHPSLGTSYDPLPHFCMLSRTARSSLANHYCNMIAPFDPDSLPAKSRYQPELCPSAQLVG